MAVPTDGHALTPHATSLSRDSQRIGVSHSGHKMKPNISRIPAKDRSDLNEPLRQLALK